MRRQVVAESRADLPALLLLAEVIYESEHQIDEPARNQGIGEIDEQVVLDEQIKRQPDQASDQTPAEHDDDTGRQHRRGNDDGEAEEDSERELGADGKVWIYQTGFAQHAFQDLGMHFDAWDRGIDRRGLQIE